MLEIGKADDPVIPVCEAMLVEHGERYAPIMCTLSAKIRLYSNRKSDTHKPWE